MAEMTYRDAINLALKEEMRHDPSVVILGEDVALYEGSFKVTRGLLAEFGEERVKDTPISENTIIGVSVGAAMGGLRPVAELMTVNFALLAMDQIVNHMTKIHYMFGGQAVLPMTIRMPGGGGSQLGAQHSQSLETFFMHCPGMRVLYPSTPADAKGLLKSAIRDNNPVIFLEHELLYNSKGEVPEDPEYLIPIGKAEVKRPGEQVTIVAYARMTVLALQAAEELAGEGISCEVVDLRSLAPLDDDTILASVSKDRPGGGGGGVLAHLRPGGRDRQPHLRELFRCPPGAGQARFRTGRAHALFAQDREALHPSGGYHHPGRKGCHERQLLNTTGR